MGTTYQLTSSDKEVVATAAAIIAEREASAKSGLDKATAARDSAGTEQSHMLATLFAAQQTLGFKTTADCTVLRGALSTAVREACGTKEKPLSASWYGKLSEACGLLRQRDGYADLKTPTAVFDAFTAEGWGSKAQIFAGLGMSSSKKQTKRERAVAAGVAYVLSCGNKPDAGKALLKAIMVKVAEAEKGSNKRPKVKAKKAKKAPKARKAPKAPKVAEVVAEVVATL